MKSLHLLLFFITLWLFTHFWLVPLVRRSWQAGELNKKIVRAGALALLEKVRDLCGVGTITLALLIALVWSLSLFAQGTAVLPEQIINSLTLFYNAIKNYGKFLLWFGILGSGAALFLVGPIARRKVTTAWRTKAQEVHEKLRENPEILNDLRGDPALRGMVERLLRNIELLNNTDSLTAIQIEEAKESIQKLLTSISLEQSKRDIDVEEILRTSAQSGSRERRKFNNPILRILSSERFSKDLGLVHRTLSLILASLLILSLTGWMASPIASSLQLVVNNLTIHSIQDHVDRTLNEAISTAQTDPLEEREEEDDNPDENHLDEARNVARTSRLLARLTINHLYNSVVLERSAGLAPSRQGRSEFVRAAILNQSRQTDGKSSPSNRIREEVAKDVSKGNIVNGPNAELLGHIEEKIKPEVEKLKQRSPRLFVKLLNRLEARYVTILSPVDAQSGLISKMVSQSFDLLDVELNSELAKQGKNITADIGKNAVSTWAESHAKALMTESLLDDARSEVFNRLRNELRFQMSDQSSDLIKEIHRTQGTGWASPKSEIVSQRISKQFAENVTKHLGRNAAIPSPGRLAAVRQNLGGYSEIFPRFAEGSASFAMNFRMASRSFRARGVLFGRDLESKITDVTDIEWEIEEQSDEVPTMLSLSLKVDGEHRHIGSFPAGIVNQALRYAADQRVVATTIIHGDDDVVERVTYTHPVLEDTPLGCRVVEADRFIDAFTSPFISPGSIDPRLQEISQRRSAIYGFLKIARIARKAAEERVCRASEMQMVVENKVDLRDLSIPAFRNDMEAFLAEGLDRDIVSTDFVERIFQCATGDTSQLGHCLCDRRFRRFALHKAYWFPEDHTSQFREKDTVLDTDFNWLKRSTSRFEHFVLWLHTTFAVRSPRNELADESTATPLDFPASQIEILNEIVPGDLLHHHLGAKLRSPSYDDFMSPLEDFVILQRLMRAALNGQLGIEFPLEKLIDLERFTREYVPYQPTIRWEPSRKSLDSFTKILTESGDDARKTYIDYQEDQHRRDSEGQPHCASASF